MSPDLKIPTFTVASNSMSSLMASRSSLLPQRSNFGCKNHVFLSFISANNNFVTSLHNELSLKGINIIKDEGKSLETDFTAMEESLFLVVVLSENYISSAECLDKLVKIIDFSETTTGHVVVPIFFNVDPSDVKNQRRMISEAFTRHEENFKEEMEKVQRWRQVLTKVATICGWESQQWEEMVLIEQIVTDISDKLDDASSNNTNDFVGMGSHIIEMEKILCLESNVVHMVGIWGMGGIGKTTVARVIYDMICSQFEIHCFSENIKENFRRHGIAFLLQKILIEKKSLSTWSFNASLNVIKRRLCHKKVLLVLDDVDDLTQLEALAREPNWFGQGSRIIITTRDKHLLVAHGVQSIYEVQYPNSDQALQLFSQYAFKQNNPKIEYLDLSQKFTSYVKGLPLALKVLGSFLNETSLIEWQRVQDKLAIIPDLNVNDVLKISFDGLDDTQKEAFLDIACFYNMESKEIVRNVFEACGFFPDITFAVLKDKALIRFSLDNKLLMHDLLQEMGREIVRQESKEPGKRSRLWIPEEIHQVLTKNKGSKTIEGISLDMSKAREMYLESNAFARMSRLRLINFYTSGSSVNHVDNVHLQHGLLSFPHQLRYLHWFRFPLKSLPSNFCAENLVKFQIVDSNVEQLWTGSEYLVHLKELDLRGCKYLTTIPNLSNAKNIETIDLEGCERLTELPSSIQYLDKLENLNLRHCAMLMSLPDKLDSNYLKEFHLTRCSNVKKCPEISSNIALLDLRYTAITDLPPFQNSTVQNELDLTGCSNLCKFPDISGNIKHLCLTDSAIEEVPSSIQFLTGLVRLIIKNNRKLLKLPDSICMLKSLKVLDLSGCTNFECFPEILEPMDSLSNLFLRQTSIKELPSPIEHLGRLTRLILDSCKKIASLSSTMHQLSRLNMIDLSCCDSLRVLPQFPQSLKNLKANHCKSLETLSSKSECNFQNMHLANCLELEGKVDAQFAIQIMAAKVCENGDEARFLFPGSEIPQWCRYKSIGSSGIIKLPSNWDKLKGVILCIVFALDQEPPRSLESPNEYWIRCKCYAKANSYEHEDLEEIIIWDRQCFDGDLHLVKSDHVFVWFNPFGTLFEGSSFVDLLKKYSGSEARFEFCIEGYSELARHCNWRVKKCGVDLLFDDEAITKETFASEEKEEIEPKPKRSKH